MASLKRYKQPSENNIHRFQDLPPRFKRQKSLTSNSKLQTSMESTNQNTHPLLKNMSSVPHQKVCSFPKEGRKIVKKLSTQKAQVNAEKNLLKPQTQPIVLSPMENKLFSLTRNDENLENTVFAGTANQNCSSNADHFLGLNTMTSLNQQTVPMCDSFTNNSNNHNATGYNTSDSYGWFETSPSNKNHSSHNQPQLSPSNVSVKSEASNSSYSDPDIRTIEMLRELERVADQTDVGNDENCNDKNLLVSHHLRMLMCAVDRYTQGVDGELESDSDSLEDETLPSEAQPIMISPLQMPVNNKPFNQEHTTGNNCASMFSKGNMSETHPVFYPTHPTIGYSAPPNHHMLDTWNPWSTPTFNALDVYASHSNNRNNSQHLNDPSMFISDYGMYHARDSCF